MKNVFLLVFIFVLVTAVMGNAAEINFGTPDYVYGDTVMPYTLSGEMQGDNLVLTLDVSQVSSIDYASVNAGVVSVQHDYTDGLGYAKVLTLVVPWATWKNDNGILNVQIYNNGWANTLDNSYLTASVVSAVNTGSGGLRVGIDFARVKYDVLVVLGMAALVLTAIGAIWAIQKANKVLSR